VNSRLASLLDRERDRIVASWISALSREQPTAATHGRPEGLQDFGQAYLAELVGYLDTDDPSRLRHFIHREATSRARGGGGAAEVVGGVLAFRDLAQSLCVEMATDPDDRRALLRTLAEATDLVVLEFVTHFQQVSESRVAGLARELEALQRALGDQSVTDPATELFTGRFFDEYLIVEVKRAARYGRGLSLLVADVDGYEAFRSRYGDPAAEQALAAVADILRKVTRDVDVKARTDVSEVSLAMPETSLESAFVVGERLRSDVAALRLGLGSDPDDGGEVTLSVGIAGHPDHGSSAAEVVIAARGARDRARLLGGNTVVIAEGRGLA
jgi:diguanylate cyclase (GGDEF)-like protein